MPKLEIITRHPKGPAHPTQLLFIHGAFASAGIWDINFLPYFAEQGYVAHAVSLRGHGGSEGKHLLPWHSLRDYIADIAETVKDFPSPPVLIGHSMGGMIIQRFLHAGGKTKGAVLMASVPPHGMWESTIGMAFRDPMLMHQLGMLMTFGPGVISSASIRRAMVSSRVPQALVDRYEHLFQSESQRVVIDMLSFNPFSWVPEPSLPILVLGAANDAFFTADQVEHTARAFGTRAVIFPEMAHGMMLEPEWPSVAETINRWLATI